MPKAKIITIITKLELGGAQEHAIYLSRCFDRDKFVPYLVSGESGLLDDEARESGATYFQVPNMVREVRPHKDIAALVALTRLIRRIKAEPPNLPVIVHTHSSKAGILGRWAAFFAGADIIIHTYHGFGFTDWQRPMVRAGFVWVERISRLITDGFITETVLHTEKGLKEKILDRSRTEMIRSGIPVDEFSKGAINRSTTRAKLEVEDDEMLVGMVACFKPQKSPVDFVDIASIVSKSFPKAKFIVAGDGELRSQMEQRIGELGLMDKIELLGWRRDLPDLMAAMDVLVLPSLWEGLPRVIPMAWAAGLPVVATAVDGLAEVIKDGVNGYLFKPKDARAGADKVIALLKDSDARKRISAAALNGVAEFDKDLMVRQHEDMYERLLEKRIVKKK